MAQTRIQDIIEPEVFTKYALNESTKLNRLIASGIIRQDAMLDGKVATGGRTTNIPRWDSLVGDDEVLHEGALSVSGITTSQDIAVILHRGKAWGSYELASMIAGSSAQRAIARFVGQWWNEREQATLMSILTGVFESPSMVDLKHGDGTQAIGAEFVLDGKQRLGDAASQLTAMAVHSAVFTTLQKQNLIDYIPDAEGRVRIPTYLGYNVIIDDQMPVNAGVYTSYLFARGVIARGTGTPVDMTATEFDRDSLSGVDILINRRAQILHPVGIAYVGTSAQPSPSNAELATGASWSRVNDVKKIGIVQLKHKI